jgi:hypothetical protein
LSGTAARVDDGDDDCGYRRRDLGAEASRRSGGKGDGRDVRPTKRARASTTSSCKEANNDLLAEERRAGRKSEANGNKPRPCVNPDARLDPGVRSARAHLFPTRVLPIHASLGLPRRTKGRNEKSA